MRIETLREFIVLAKYLSFSAAADELHLSQSAMSVHISGMEKELGYKLVDRSHGVALTSVGQSFLIGAQEAVSAYDGAVRKCNELAKGHPAVRVKTSGSSPFLASLLESAGSVPIELVEVPVDAYGPLEELAKGLVDVCDCREFSYSEDVSAFADKHGIACTYAGKDRVRIYMSKDNPLAAKSALQRRDLASASVAVLSSKWYDFLVLQAKQLLGEDLGLAFRMISTSSPLMQRYADLGSSIALSGENLDYFSERDDVAWFDELDGEPLYFDTVFAYRIDDPNPNVHTLMEAVSKTNG